MDFLKTLFLGGLAIIAGVFAFLKLSKSESDNTSHSSASNPKTTLTTSSINCKIHVIIPSDEAKQLNFTNLSNENIRNILLYSRGILVGSNLDTSKYVIRQSETQGMIIEFIGKGISSLSNAKSTDSLRDMLSQENSFSCSKINTYNVFDFGDVKFFD